MPLSIQTVPSHPLILHSMIGMGMRMGDGIFSSSFACLRGGLDYGITKSF